MSSRFEIRYRWLGERASDPEQASLAALSIFVDGICVTEVEDQLVQTTRDSVNASALQLAEWLAGNWWRLMWETGGADFEWRVAHCLGSAGGGYVWPDLTFSSDWNTLLVTACVRDPRAWEPISYLRGLRRHVALSEFERAVDDFVHATLARVAGLGERADELSDLWAELGHERGEPALAERRRLEACLGFDPDEAPEGLVSGLLDKAASLGTEAVLQMAASGKTETLSHLEAIADALGSAAAPVSVSNYGHLRCFVAEAWNSFDAPWRRGVAAAKEARKLWGLGVEPLVGDRLEELFGVRLSDAVAQGSHDLPVSAGLREGAASGRFRVALNRSRETGRRFALARLVADDLLAGDGDRLLASTEVRTARQRFQRAFAQELLCPFVGIQEFLN